MEGGCCGSAAAHATPSSCLPLLAAPSHGSGSWLVFKVERKGGLCRLVVEWKVVALWLAVLCCSCLTVCRALDVDMHSERCCLCTRSESKPTTLSFPVHRLA